MTHATIEIDGIEYSATVDGKAVTIYRDGSWLGKGRWDAALSMIEDCAADLPESVYVALDAAIVAAMTRAA